jgi:membrane dipeptidase
MVDLSHVTPQTMHDVLDITRSPVLFSHSATRALYDHPRNIPDSVLERIGSKPGQNPGVIHSILTDLFMGPGNATIDTVVDHVEYIAHKCGKAHVGLGSDFDGMPSTVKGLDGVQDWPKLVGGISRWLPPR